MLCGYKINLQKSRVFSILIITKYNFFLNFKLRKVHMRTSWIWGIWEDHRMPVQKICSMLLLVESCPTLCDPTDCSPPGSSVHGISQARVIEWVAISFSRGSSQPRDGTCISCIDRRILYYWSTSEAPFVNYTMGKTQAGNNISGSILWRWVAKRPY